MNQVKKLPFEIHTFLQNFSLHTGQQRLAESLFRPPSPFVSLFPVWRPDGAGRWRPFCCRAGRLSDTILPPVYRPAQYRSRGRSSCPH